MTGDDRSVADTVEIMQLYARYEQWCDAGPFEGLVALFTDDGTVVNAAGTFTGHGALLAHYRDWRSDPRFAAMAAGRHLFTTPMITVDGDEATGATHSLFALPTAEGPPNIAHFTRYEDRLVRGPDGRWRFASRTVVALA
jgi:hypothetical protein